jgi:hypothetical protein
MMYFKDNFNISVKLGSNKRDYGFEIYSKDEHIK